jgi:hypothetical protein
LLVAAVVVAFFLFEVEVEVFVEVAVAGEGAELEDGFGAVEAPSGAGDFQAVFDEPPGRAFDRAAGDEAPPAGLASKVPNRSDPSTLAWPSRYPSALRRRPRHPGRPTLLVALVWPW